MNKQDVTMQLYTTRHFQPYEPILKFLSNSGIVNIELFGLESMNTDEFKSMMDQSNITSKSTHVGFESLSDSDNIINRANKMNIKHIIVPAPPARKDAEFKNTFDMDEEEWMDFGKKLSSFEAKLSNPEACIAKYPPGSKFKAKKPSFMLHLDNPPLQETPLDENGKMLRRVYRPTKIIDSSEVNQLVTRTVEINRLPKVKGRKSKRGVYHRSWLTLLADYENYISSKEKDRLNAENLFKK